jgi:hypothetical protein
MSGRRNHQRVNIGYRAEGQVRVVRNVTIERMDDEELVVISPTAAIEGEQMLLELFSGDRRFALTITVRNSRPVLIGGSMRHRLRVVIDSLQPEVHGPGKTGTAAQHEWFRLPGRDN